MRLAVLVLCGCGRLAFDPRVAGDAGSAGDATGDAAPVLGCGFVELELGHFHSCARDAQNAVYCWGDNTYGQLGDGSFAPRYMPTTPIAGTFAKLARSDHDTACAIAPDTTLWCWGRSRNYQLGSPSLGTGVIAMTQVRGQPVLCP